MGCGASSEAGAVVAEPAGPRHKNGDNSEATYDATGKGKVKFVAEEEDEKSWKKEKSQDVAAVALNPEDRLAAAAASFTAAVHDMKRTGNGMMGVQRASRATSVKHRSSADIGDDYTDGSSSLRPGAASKSFTAPSGRSFTAGLQASSKSFTAGAASQHRRLTQQFESHKSYASVEGQASQAGGRSGHASHAGGRSRAGAQAAEAKTGGGYRAARRHAQQLQSVGA